MDVPVNHTYTDSLAVCQKLPSLQSCNLLLNGSPADICTVSILKLVIFYYILVFLSRLDTTPDHITSNIQGTVHVSAAISTTNIEGG